MSCALPTKKGLSRLIGHVLFSTHTPNEAVIRTSSYETGLANMVCAFFVVLPL